MLSKPKFMSPSTNVEKRVVNANNDSMSFSFIVDGNEAIDGVYVKIYDIEKDEIILSSAYNWNINGDIINDVIFEDIFKYGVFYPINENNENNLFLFNMKSKDSSETQIITNREEPYYWTVSVKGTSGQEVTSCEEVFYANTPPDLVIKYSYDKSNYTDITNGSSLTLNQRACYFKATYTQAEGVPLKKYGWRLTDKNSGEILIDTISKNQIYGTANNILCGYNGLMNDCTYLLELYVETQNGYVVLTEREFSVSYETTYLTSDFRIESLKSESGIILDWTKSVVISGRKTNNVSYLYNYPIVNNDISDIDETTGLHSNNCVSIPKGDSLTFDYGSNSNLDISEESYVVLSMQMPNNEDVVLFEATGENTDGFDLVRKLSFIEGKFVYSILGNQGMMITKEYNPVYSPNDYVWYVITMSPILFDETGKEYIDLIVNENIAEGGLYPSDSLYPSDDLYPYFGKWVLKVENGVKVEAGD